MCYAKFEYMKVSLFQYSIVNFKKSGQSSDSLLFFKYKNVFST